MNNQNQVSIVEEIRHFIKKENSDIIKNSDMKILEIDNNKLQRLKKLQNLGFEKCKNVIDNSQYIFEEQYNDYMKMVHHYYDNKYPGKFFDYSIFKKLNEKYGLVIGNANLFIDNIPESVITNILNFNFDIEDTILEFSHSIREQYYELEKAKYFEEKNFNEKVLSRDLYYYNAKKYFHHSNEYNIKLENNFYSYLRKTNKLENFKKDFFIKIESGELEYSGYEKENDLSFRVNPFVVIASPDKFDMKNKEVIGGEIKEITNNDPIICIRVKNGFLYVDSYDIEDQINFIETRFEKNDNFDKLENLMN